MPFDPDAYLAGKSAAPAAGGFDPDAYLKSKSPSAATPTPVAAPQSGWEKFKDGFNLPRDFAGSMITSAVAAPIANVAGLAATGYEAIARGSKGDGDMPGKFREAVRDKLTYKPKNKLLDEIMEIPRQAGQAVSSFGSSVKDSLKDGASDNSVRGMAVNALGEAAVQAPGFIGMKAAPMVPRIAENIGGSAARAARGEAMGSARGVLGDVESTLGGKQAGKFSEAQAYEDMAVRTQRDLDAARQRPGVPTQDVLGEQVRSSYSKIMEDAKAARGSAVEPLYAKAQEVATARERDGMRVNVAPAVADLDKMMEVSSNLPDLQAKLSKLRNAIQPASATGESVAAPVGRGAISSKLKAPTTPLPPRPGLTYQELDMASRYIKDIAFSGEAEGYGALVRNTAKKLSVTLDKQISEFIPEHAAATAKYRELSQPMETMATRIGNSLYDTEGGLKGDAYAKVSSQDLPSRIFGKKDRIDQLVDAMAGGKTATAEARIAAQAKVDTWVENWVLDSNRGKTPGLGAPGERAALNASPGAQQRLAGTASREGAQEARVPELQAGAKASREEARIAETAKLKVRSAINQAEIDLQHGATKDAYNGYVGALRQNMAVADPGRYRAAIALIERASTLEAKTAKARKLAMALAGVAGVSGAAAVGVKIPGAL